jgi:co-chaperonin GroES (HSP10)
MTNKFKFTRELDNNPENLPAHRVSAASKRIRKINPLGFRVVVKIEKESNVSEGGLYLPEGAKQAMEEAIVARVVEVASAREEDTDEDTNISGVPLDSTVLIPKTAGIKIPWDESLRIVETKEILAMVDEISLT